MGKYEEKRVWCNLCRTRVPVVFGKKGLCGPCHKIYYGNTKTLTAMEQAVIEKENEIADLQTIINLLEDMQKKLDAHNNRIAVKE